MTTRRHYAFTVMELMIVVLIIVLLIAMLLPALSYARSQARKAKCAANLHSFGVAIGTRQSQAVGTGGNVNAFGLMDLRPFLSDSRVYLCPEDIAPSVSTNAQIATFSSSTQNSSTFLFDMAIAPGTYCWQTVLSSTNYLLNFEDQQSFQNGGDFSFYNFYLSVTTDASGDITLTSLNVAPPGDTTPPTCKRSSTGPDTPISGGDTYQLVDLNGAIIKAPINRGDSPVTLVSIPTSYGMNTLYPASMASNGIAILDYLSLSADVAGLGRDSSQFHAYQLPNAITGRPGFNRHLGRFNALFMDGSVETSIAPATVDPTTNARNRQMWWGDAKWATD